MAVRALTSRRRGGFTLIEMLVVTVVIAVLALLVIPRAMGARRRAKGAQLRGNLKQLRDRVEHFEATVAACAERPNGGERHRRQRRLRRSRRLGWTGPPVMVAISSPETAAFPVTLSRVRPTGPTTTLAATFTAALL